jgi:hypothetical protein
MAIAEITNDILGDVLAAASMSQLYIIAVSVKTVQQAGESPRLDIIQIRTRDNIYALKVRTIFCLS